MNEGKRPVFVTVVACLYIAVGAMGFIAHGWEGWARGDIHWDTLSIEFVELVAVGSGIFLLRGRNWARWLALAWMAFHVAISLPELRQAAVHSVFRALIAWALFCPPAMRYFRGQTRPA